VALSPEERAVQVTPPSIVRKRVPELPPAKHEKAEPQDTLYRSTLTEEVAAVHVGVAVSVL
jgi:hypothetical protein